MRSVAGLSGPSIPLPLRALVLGPLPTIRRQGAAHIIGLLELTVVFRRTYRLSVPVLIGSALHGLLGHGNPPSLRRCNRGAGEAADRPITITLWVAFRSSLITRPSSGRTFATRGVDVTTLDSASVLPRERREQQQRERLIATIAAEYREMAGLSLTQAQARRLFGIQGRQV